MINREALALCRPGVLLINTARGGLIDSSALIEALDSGRVAGVGLDVLEDERVFRGGATQILSEKIAERVRSSAGTMIRETSAQRVSEFSKLVAHHRLLNRPEVVLTPHVAFNSHEAMERLTGITDRKHKRLPRGPRGRPPAHELLARQAGADGLFLGRLRQGWKDRWTGVRNFQARNNLRSMKAGDRVLFYHSVTDKAIIGEAEVLREAFADPTATGGNWVAVELKPLKPLRRRVSLEEIKADKKLSQLALVRSPRLSVMPVTADEYRAIMALSKVDFTGAEWEAGRLCDDEDLSPRGSCFHLLTDV